MSWSIRCAFAFDESETNFKKCCDQALKLTMSSCFIWFCHGSCIKYHYNCQIYLSIQNSLLCMCHASLLTSNTFCPMPINFDIILCNHYDFPMCQITQYTRTIYSRVIITPLDHMSCPDNLLSDYHNNWTLYNRSQWPFHPLGNTEPIASYHNHHHHCHHHHVHQHCNHPVLHLAIKMVAGGGAELIHRCLL